MGEIWGPVIGSLGFTALIVTPIIVNKIIKFKLEIARINAETAIKSEEIRARNQLEIERMLKAEQRRSFEYDERIQDSSNRIIESL